MSKLKLQLYVALRLQEIEEGINECFSINDIYDIIPYYRNLETKLKRAKAMLCDDQIDNSVILPILIEDYERTKKCIEFEINRVHLLKTCTYVLQDDKESVSQKWVPYDAAEINEKGSRLKEQQERLCFINDCIQYL